MAGLLAALGAAMVWTTASSLWRSVSSSGSALQLNTIKNGLATLLFLPVLVSLPWHDNGKGVTLLLLSGVVGIAFGDSFYLAALRRLGTRRTLTVEAIGPVLGSIGSVLLMQDTLPWKAWIGAVLVSSAVLLVARQSAEPNRSDTGKSPVIHGLLLSLMAVISGLAGAFLARHVLLETSLSPLQTAAVRLLGGWLVLMPVLRKTPGTQQNRGWGSWCRIGLATVLGTNVGIALQQLVFHELPVGPGVTLMATAPVMALLIAPLEGDAIQPLGVLAAVLALAGVAVTTL
jgi:drug/metabolite transporter (DMT)-like permease